MKEIKNQAMLQGYLARYGLADMFSTPDLHFRLLQYGKGEFLTSPGRQPEQLLFLVEGSAHIFGLRQDDSVSPVAVAEPLTMLGDVEFASGEPSSYFVEAQEEVLCVGLSLSRYGKTLREDTRFLNQLLKSLGGKLIRNSAMEIGTVGLEMQVLFYLKNYCPDGCIHSVNTTMVQLRCSRRQLQRVLKKLCDTGAIEKLGKGTYRLSAQAVR